MYPAEPTQVSYKLLSASSPDGLNQMVTAHLRQGWVLHGSPSTVGWGYVHQSGSSTDLSRYSQAVLWVPQAAGL
jgi:hypothetical protein